jgi:hypothetical protein
MPFVAPATKVLLVLGGIYAVLRISTSRRYRRPASRSHGLELRGDDLRVVSLDAALPFLAHATADAVQKGAVNAEQVVSHALRQVFPQRAWPPLVESPLRQTFERMVDAIRPMVREPSRTGVGLHIVS